MQRMQTDAEFTQCYMLSPIAWPAPLRQDPCLLCALAEGGTVPGTWDASKIGLTWNGMALCSLYSVATQSGSLRPEASAPARWKPAY